MPSPILQVQFALLSYLARFFQPHARREQHDGIDFSCRMRAYGNTTHTGYTLLFICFCRVGFVYGSDGTAYDTNTAPNAILIRSGYETARRSLFIEMTSGNFRNRTVAFLKYFFYFLRIHVQHVFIRIVRTARGILTGYGILRCVKPRKQNCRAAVAKSYP